MSQPASAPQISFQLFENYSLLGLRRVLGRLWPTDTGRRTGIILVVAITWIPLLVLSALQHMALGSTRTQSFAMDIGLHVRFLVALPMIMIIPANVGGKLRTIVEHFLKARLIRDSERERFVGNVASAMKLRHAPIADWLILVLVYATATLLFLRYVGHLAPSWRTTDIDARQHLSAAGGWFLWVSEPIFQFVFYRFLYRIGLWWLFLWKTSRLEIAVDAAHPDGAGGLGFLGLTLRSFKEAAFALSTAFAAPIATVVVLTHTKVSSYKYEIAAVVIMITVLFAGPLLFFYSALVRIKTRDTLEYWSLWQIQQRQFQRKWLNDPSEHADMLNVPDFSEVTDLSQILERVRALKLIPFGRQQIQPVVIAALLPFVAVSLLEFPFEEIVKQVLRLGGFSL